MKKSLLFKPSVRNLSLLVAFAAIDIGLYFAAAALHLPFWLDTTGTMAAAISLGPVAGILTGVASSLALWAFAGNSFLYSIVAAAVGLVIGLMLRNDRSHSKLYIVSVSMFAGIISTIISLPLNSVYNDGKTGNLWGDALMSMLEQNVSSRRFNIFTSVAFIALPDRVVSAFTALFILKIIKPCFESQKKVKGIKVGTFILALLMTLNCGMLNVRAVDYAASYEVVFYSSKDGIPRSNANAVTQTPDGYLWVGTYSGLYMYDGVRFEEAELHDSIHSVKELFADSKGRLWIGTTESGIFCYDSSDRSTKQFSTKDGLGSDYVRAICEGTDGNIYVGTSTAVSRISSEGQVKTYHEWKDIMQVQSLAAKSDGSLIGVTNSGKLFLVKDDMLLDTVECEEHGIEYRSAAIVGETVYAGTSDSLVDKYTIEDSAFKKTGSLTLPKAKYCNRMKVNGNGVFYCCESGQGCIVSTNDRVISMTRPDFKEDISDVCPDSQGNIWFASSKQGIIKYSASPFKSILQKIRLTSKVINALMLDGDLLYIGTDSGMYRYDMQSGDLIDEELPEYLTEERIRHIFRDSHGNIWVSGYGAHGLVRIASDGKIECVSSADENLSGLKYRFVTELSDGRLLASANTGLVFLKDGKSDGKITEADGLKNATILSAVEREDGTILAGSDGDGIYIIKNGKVAGHIGTDEGLDSNVVMRIVPCSGGYLYVTSNGLYFDEQGSVRRLKNFPFFNNYDILISEDKNCYITSSAGLFIVSEDNLLKDGKYAYTLLDDSWGLNTSFTSNSWNVMYNGSLYLCCTDGARMVSMSDQVNSDTEYQLHLKSIEADGKKLSAENGEWSIPSETRRILLNIAVNNYSLSNPLIHYYLEGANDDGITCYQNEITPLSFTYLPHGKYSLHIDVLDSLTGEVVKSEVIPIEKKAVMYERWYFKLYLFLVIMQIFMYFIWVITFIRSKVVSIGKLQREVSTDPMTGLLNKAGSIKSLEKECSEGRGVLMMIDLDSFKLVNDIYGHEMGDRILIRFAELITEALGEENIRGRMGGDEFVGFIRDGSEEQTERITSFLNRELVISAKEFMGEDMNIPIGTSIGAVHVPDEGKDFHELFKLADKALYVVKQNGKHGCSFYRRNADTAENEETNAGDLSRIIQIIGERNEGKGAFSVSFDKMQVIYKYLARNSKMNSSSAAILRFALSDPEKITDEVMDGFEEHLIVGLKKNDVVSRYAGCFFVLLNDLAGEDAERVALRLKESWEKSEVSGGTTASCEFERI